MRRSITVRLVVGCLAALPASFAAAQDLDRDQIEEFLRTAEIVRQEEIGQGVTRPIRATLSDGTFTHDAQIQNVDIFEREFQTARGTELNFRDSYKYNIAAYLLDAHLGLDMTPVSVERRVGSRTAALTWWIDDVMMDEWTRVQEQERSPDPRRWASQMYLVRIFDQLIDNSDRNGGNLLITEDWNIWMIDHTRAFRTQKRLRAPDDLQWCERGLLEKLRVLDEATLETLLGDYLSGPEIEGLAARAELIVEHFDTLIEERGQAQVLFTLPPR